MTAFARRRAVRFDRERPLARAKQDRTRERERHFVRVEHPHPHAFQLGTHLVRVLGVVVVLIVIEVVIGCIQIFAGGH